MRVGVHLVDFTLPEGPAALRPTLAAVARAADEAGVAIEGTDYDRIRKTVPYAAPLSPGAKASGSRTR